MEGSSAMAHHGRLLAHHYPRHHALRYQVALRRDCTQIWNLSLWSMLCQYEKRFQLLSPITEPPQNQPWPFSHAFRERFPRTSSTVFLGWVDA
eukprot:126260-Rhodomonas_salina.3